VFSVYTSSDAYDGIYMKYFRSNFSSLIWVIIAGVALSRIGLSMSVPFITFFLYQHAGVSLFYAGLVVAISFVTYVIGGFIGGTLSDLLGRKKILLVSLFCHGIVFLGFGLVGTFVHIKLILVMSFFLLNTLAGFCRAWSDALGQVIISDLCTGDQKRLAFSYRYIAANVGAAIGPFLGVIFGCSGSTKGFYITGYMLLAYFFLFKLLSKKLQYINSNLNKLSFAQAFNIVMQDKTMRYFITAGGVIYFGYVQQEAIFGIIIIHQLRNIHLLAMMLSLNALIIIFFQLPLTIFINNFAPLKVMIIGGLLIAFSLVIIGLAGKTASLYFVGEVVFTIGEMLVMPLNSVVVDSLAPASLRGTYFGAAGFQFTGRILGPIFSSILMTHFGASVTMIIVAIITCISTLFYYLGFCSMQKSLLTI